MSETASPVRILFVCTGNICRSPTAEGVFRAMVTACGLGGRIETDSAGTGGWHIGEPPDRRTQETARSRGIDLSASAPARSRPRISPASTWWWRSTATITASFSPSPRRSIATACGC